MTADAATIRARVERYLGDFGGDREVFLDNFASDAWIEDPVGSPRLVGRDAIGGFYDQSVGMADSIELRPAGPLRIAAGEAAFAMQARPVLGGTTFAVDIIDVMTFDADGRIATMRAYWDAADMAPASD